MIKEAILKVCDHQDLTYNEAYMVMDQIISGEVSETQIGAYLTAMSMKRETIDEMTASLKALRAHCVRLLDDRKVLEIVKAGSESLFDISTISSIVISAAGVPVAKHGVLDSNSYGSGNVLEELGANIHIDPEKCLRCLDEINLCFLFPQNYHLAMRYIDNISKELPIKTIFDTLAPLTNPSGARMLMLGVSEKNVAEPIMNALKYSDVDSAVAIYGMDEISLDDETFVCELKGGKTITYEISQEYFGMESASRKDLEVENPHKNAEIALSILNGQKGPKRNAVVLNSAIGLYVADKVESLRKGVELAVELIDSKKALKQLEKFIEFTNS